MPIIPNPYDPERVGSPAWKIPVEAAETAGNINITNPSTNIIGGTSITQDQYVVLANQTDPAEHGIYLFDTSSTPLVRAVWANTSDKIDNAVVVVDNGTNERKIFSFDIDGTRILETDPIVVTEVTGGVSADEKTKVSTNDTTTDFLINKVTAGTGITINELNDGGDEDLEIVNSAPDDQTSKVSANDTTSAFLSTKIVAGTGINVNELNDGGNETLEIVNTVVDTNTDEVVKVTANDTTADYLLNKITAGTGITLNELNDGSNETLEVVVTNPNTDETAKVSVNDTTAGFLNGKLVAGTNITLNELNDGLNETLEVVANIPAGSDELVKVSSNDTTADYLENKLVGGNLINITVQNDGLNETVLIAVGLLSISSISDFVESNYVHTTGDEDVGGTKTFTSGTIVIDSPATTGDLNIGYMTSPSLNCYGIARTDASGVFCLMGNANYPQIFLGKENNTTGQGYIDVDNNRPLNLNVLDTGAGTPALVRIGSGGLEINSGGNIDILGGNILMAATQTVDGVDVGSPKNSITIDTNQYQLVNDQLSPGNDKMYATNGSGVKGWIDIPASKTSKTFSYTADSVISPTGSDWAISDYASLGNDTNNSSLRVRRFDNSFQEGIGFVHNIPSGATNVTFKFKTRAETTPLPGDTAIVNVYRRNISDDTAVPAWSSAQALTAFSYPANENWQFDEQTFSLVTLGLTAGDIAEYEITRNGGTMNADMTLLLLEVEYT